MKTNGSDGHAKGMSDLVLDRIVLVRLHRFRGLLLHCIGGLTLCRGRGRATLLIGRGCGGDRLIDFHLCILFSCLGGSLRLLLGSRRYSLGLFLGQV